MPSRSPVGKQTPVRPNQLYIRLLPAINEALRSKGRYKGDLSRIIEEALMDEDADLMTIRLVDLSSPVAHLSVAASLSDKCRRRLKQISVKRGASMNALVNAALARSLKVNVKEPKG